MKEFDGFRLASREPLTEAERGWIDILRAIYPGGVPVPSLMMTEELRRALHPAVGAETRSRTC